MKPSPLPLGLGLVLGLASSTGIPAQTRIYLANDDHTDYMWTADADTYNAVFVDMLDYYLHLAEDTTNNPAPFQSRFNADGSYWLWNYERQKSPAEFDRLMARIKDGHISAPLNTLVSCYGAQPTEAVLRGMYYAGRLERRYQMRFPLAIAMENQTLPLGLASAKRQTTPDRQVIVSNTMDFFEDFETKYGADLPSESVTYGNEWDLYSASMVETSARVRRSVEKLRAAELTSTLVALQSPDFLKGREKSRDQAFTDLGLYWEHDWTADGPVSRARRAAWQEMLAGEIEYYVNPLHDDAAARLGYLIQKPAGAPQRFFALNPLGESRTDYADFAYTGSANIHVRDVSTGKDVAHQIVMLEGARFLRILASDVPSAGYKTYEILNGPGSAPTDAAAQSSGGSGGSRTLENSAVKLVIEPGGAIASLIDKKRGNTELAAAIGGLKLNDLSPGDDSGTIVVENAGPVSVTLHCLSEAGLPHTTWITLYRDSDRIDIRNRITANFSDVRYWSFGFNLASPDIHTEELGTILRDRLKSQGGDYADSHARYDHVTLNHFADITDGAGTKGVTLSNADCSFARLGNSTSQHLDTTTPQIHVLAGGQVDGRYLGIQNQNGATSFLQRFALHPHAAYDSVTAMRFALEHQNPLVTGGISGTETSPYPATSYALLTLSDPAVLLWAVKPAEEGIDHGIIVRLWNVGTAPRSVRATLATGLSGATQTTHIETDLAALPVTGSTVEVKMNRAQIQTLRLIGPPTTTK